MKTFNADFYAEQGLPTQWREEYYSYSKKGVIRGMHFQTPPHDHEKLVYCMQGSVLDVVLDLRSASPTFGDHCAFELDGSQGQGLMITKGIAHGFLAMTDDVLMLYKVTSVYSSDNDRGIRWDSFGFDWTVNEPIVSTRDRTHPTFADFVSPF